MSLPGAVGRRLDDLATRHALPAHARERLAILLEELAADPHAPTTVRDPALAVDAHVADALSGLDAPALRDAGTIADLGAGAGLPGLVLAAARPDARVVLVESVGRKCAFIDRLAAAMSLDNTEVVPGRAETWREGVEACDVVTARALAPLPVLVEYAAPLLRRGGMLIAWKGRPEKAEARDGDHAARLLGMAAAEVHRVEPWPGADRHSLFLYRKVCATPSGFPRRPGIARKRPLGAAGSA